MTGSGVMGSGVMGSSAGGSSPTDPSAPDPAGRRRHRILDWTGLLVRLGLAAVWFISGIAKASDPLETVVAVRAYQLLPESAVRPVAAVLPYWEIAFGLLLLVGAATRLAAVASAVLLLVFIGGVVSAAARGLAIDCGCFGGGGAVSAGRTRYAAEVARDVGFLVLAGYLTWRPGSALSVDGWAAARGRDSQSGQA